MTCWCISTELCTDKRTSFGFQFLLVSYLKSMLTQRTCKKTYTNGTSKSHCNGWSNTGLEVCREKGFRNEIPGDCDQEAKHRCKFVIWAPLQPHAKDSTGPCHLAAIETCGDFNETEDYAVSQMYTFSPLIIETAGSYYWTIYSLAMIYFTFWAHSVKQALLAKCYNRWASTRRFWTILMFSCRRI